MLLLLLFSLCNCTLTHGSLASLSNRSFTSLSNYSFTPLSNYSSIPSLLRHLLRRRWRRWRNPLLRSLHQHPQLHPHLPLSLPQRLPAIIKHKFLHRAHHPLQFLLTRLLTLLLRKHNLNPKPLLQKPAHLPQLILQIMGIDTPRYLHLLGHMSFTLLLRPFLQPLRFQPF
ncbi:hypothetical protein AA313_de0201865 [Arthrobotrys entomopaga]|nr:hypothetical protein AA313_de0201865 [Arthrobotrys entomopaga]